MGDPKFSRKKYETPAHPWQGARIKEENELVKKYGLKNKREVWKARSLLRSIRGQARDLQGKQRIDSPQIRLETRGLIARMHREGLLPENATLDDVLALNVEAVLMRRLQTQTYLRGLAATPSQARQLIVHGHVSLDGHRVTIPGMVVTREQETTITYSPNSPLQNEQHPVRPKIIEAQELAPGDMERQEYEARQAARGGPRGRGGGGRGGPGGRGGRRREGGGSRPKGGRRNPPASEGGAGGGA